MRILFLSRYQDTIQRGAETFVKELSKQLSKRHEVSIFSGEKSDSLDEVYKGNYQVVVSINGGLQSLKASLGRIKGHYKLVITGQAGIGRSDIFNLTLAKPDLYVALTEPMYKWAKKWAWGSKVIKIPNGVDLNKFTPDGKKMDFGFQKPIVLSVGALVWYKHHEKTIKAISRLEGASLVIVGDGPEKEKLEDLGKKLLGNRFKIMKADYEDLPTIYRSSDIFVLPSWDREAFGIVYLEAMASGLGVVAPNDSSRKEIIGDAGILVDVSDVQKYSEAIKHALLSSWKTKALNQVRKFSWEKVAKEYEKAFNNL